MPQDPFQGRASSEGAPYDHALTVTRADGDTLPVIPSAFYLPGVLGAEDATRPNRYYTKGAQNPFQVYQVHLEMLNGAQIEIRTAGISLQTGMSTMPCASVRSFGTAALTCRLSRSCGDLMARPPRLCSCGQIVPADQLCACQVVAMRARKTRHDRTRPSSSARGYDGEWRKLRAAFLRDHPFCAFCGGHAEHVDHKTRHRGDKALLLSWANLQSLCAHCHNSVKQRQERAANA